MKKLLTILFGAFMVVAAYGQYPEVEELDDGATFGEQRTKINDDIRLDNQQSDSLVAHLVRLEGIGDSLAVHNLIIWNNTDAIAGQKDDITDLTADVDANTGNISTNATNISNNSISIGTNASDISDNSDSLGVIRPDVNDNTTTAAASEIDIINYETRIKALEEYLWPDVPSGTLLDYYKFEQNGLDETGYNRHSTTYNVNYGDLDAGDYSINFHSDTSYITTPSYDFTSAWTFMFNTKFTDLRSYNRGAFGNLSANDGFDIRMNDNSDMLMVITGDGATLDTLFAPTSINTDTIYPYKGYHWAITSDGDVWKNGRSVSTTGSITSGMNTSGSISIGRNSVGTAHFYGYMNDWKSFSGALDSAQVSSHYLSNPDYSTTQNSLPSFASGVVPKDFPSALNLNFTENIYNVSDSATDAFTVYASDSIWGVDSSKVNFNTLLLYLDNPITAGKEMKVTYDDDYFSGLEDFEANKISGFVKRDVVNNIEEAPVPDSITTATAIYWFENNVKDSANNYHMLATETSFTTDFSPPQGSYAATMPGSRDYSVPSLGIADTFSVSMWVNPSNTGINGQEIFIVGNLKVELDMLSSGRLQCHVNSVEAYTANAAVTADAWNHIAFTYNTTTGVFTVYVNGVDLAGPSTPQAGADLTGDCAFMEVCFGYFDASQIYNSKTIDATEAKFLFDNPENSLKTTGVVIKDPEVPQIGQAPWETYLDAWLIVDFDDEDLGVRTPSLRPALFDEWSYDFESLSTTKTVPILNADRPFIVDYTYDSAGVSVHDRGIRLTMKEGVGNLDHLPVNDNVALMDPANRDYTRVRGLLTYNITYVESNAWNNLPAGVVWKNCGLYAGLTYPKTEISRNSSKFNLIASLESGGDAYTFVKNKVIVKPWSQGDGLIKHRAYPGGGWIGDRYAYYVLIDSDGSTVQFDLANDSVTLNITIYIELGDVNGTNGWYAYYINGECVGIYDVDDVTGEPIILRNHADVLIDGFGFDYHWGGGNDEVPVGSNASIIYDDIFIGKFKDSYSGWQNGVKPQVGDLIQLPNYVRTGSFTGYKLKNWTDTTE